MKYRFMMFVSFIIASSLTAIAGPQEKGAEAEVNTPDTSAREAVLDTAVPSEAEEQTSTQETAGVEADSAVHSKILDTLAIKRLTINSPDVIRNAIGLRRSSPFSAPDIKEAIRRLNGLGLFRSIDIHVTAETDSSASLLVEVEEFPFIESIEFAGLKKIKQKDLEEKFPVKKGRIVSDNVVFQGEQHIKKLYEKKGYLLAEIAVERIASKVPGNVNLKYVVREGPKVRIKAITFKGNKDVKESKLKGKLKTKENRWWRSGEYNEENYRAHLDTLLIFYNDLGYLDASIVRDSVWYSESKKDIFVEITIEEGKKYYAGKFSFAGNTVIPTDSLLKKIALKEGKPFQKSRFDMSKYFVENAYREEGYLWVQVDDRRRFRGDTIDVTFNIYEGKPAIVRKVEIRGNTKTREKVVRREIDLLPGQRYCQSLMASSRQRVFALNYFSDVKPDLIPNNDGTIDMLFEVTEKDNIGTFQVGAAYSQTEKIIGTLALGIPNFRGTGEELKIDLHAGKYSRRVDLGFKEPYAFDSPTSLSGEIFYNWGVPQYASFGYSAYDTVKSYGFRIGAGRSRLSWPDSHFSINGSYQLSYEMSSYGDDTSSSFLKVLRDGFLSRLTLGITRYDLDMPQFPTTGSRLTIVPEIAGLGGDFKYLKGSVEYEHYFPLPFKFVLGSRTKVGLIEPLGGGPVKIGRWDLYKSGGVYGDANVRGYEEYAIGGLRNPEQGLAMFASTLELRYPLLPQQLYIGVFADAGNTWSSISKMDLGNLYKGVGLGIRLNIPMMGLMGFDFGYGFDNDKGPGVSGKPNGWEVHFLMNRGF